MAKTPRNPMPQVHLLTKEGCVYCDKAKDKYGDHPDVNIVPCTGKGAADHPQAKLCKGVDRFPTFKLDDSTTCFVGFTDSSHTLATECKMTPPPTK